MLPIKFPEQTTILAKNQPQFQPLPVCVVPTDEQGVYQFICKYQLSELELAQISRTGCVYFAQFGSGFHPIRPNIESPFGVCKVIYKKTVEGNYNFWVGMTDGSTMEIKDIPVDKVIDTIMQKITNITAEQIYFEEKPSMAIGEGGVLINMP